MADTRRFSQRSPTFRPAGRPVIKFYDISQPFIFLSDTRVDLDLAVELITSGRHYVKPNQMAHRGPNGIVFNDVVYITF